MWITERIGMLQVGPAAMSTRRIQHKPSNSLIDNPTASTHVQLEQMFYSLHRKTNIVGHRRRLKPGTMDRGATFDRKNL